MSLEDKGASASPSMTDAALIRTEPEAPSAADQSKETTEPSSKAKDDSMMGKDDPSTKEPKKADAPSTAGAGSHSQDQGTAKDQPQQATQQEQPSIDPEKESLVGKDDPSATDQSQQTTKSQPSSIGKRSLPIRSEDPTTPTTKSPPRAMVPGTTRAQALSFEARVEQLKEYKKKHGNCNVPVKYDKIPGLGHFVSEKRRHFRQGKLSRARVETLEALGFRWYLGVVKHVASTEKASPPKTLTLTARTKQYTTLLTQERETTARLRKELQLRDEVEELMEAEIERLTKASFEQELIKLKEELARVKEELTNERFKSEQCRKQRNHAQKQRNKMKKRIEMLTRNSRKQTKADLEALDDDQVAALVSIEGINSKDSDTATNGDGGNTADGDDEEGRARKKAKLAHDILVKKTATGTDSFNDLLWIERFEELKLFKAEFGHCNVPCRKTIVRNGRNKWFKLACWVGAQRTEHRKLREGRWSYLTPERVRILTLIGFVWEAAPSHQVTLPFDERVAQLAEYKEEHGDCNIPQKYKKCPGLGNFVLEQRKNYRLGVLPRERIEKLEAVGFRWSLRNKGGTLEERMRKAQGLPPLEEDSPDSGGEESETRQRYEDYDSVPVGVAAPAPPPPDENPYNHHGTYGVGKSSRLHHLAAVTEVATQHAYPTDPQHQNGWPETPEGSTRASRPGHRFVYDS
eukprot:CAMPEP_0172450904 /NCGR_PEP_ID=MMETSP1065-20121228/9094_1 /TAXON_ID=265537 /ORGANISM="Amphiprora paludosa, Strain CCMP125" /LENGTH=689 /DNA_ID=CAMNT_0013202751 /DNA_START=70 /DNA_END=2139 /DNA_ORIENTATION=+